MGFAKSTDNATENLAIVLRCPRRDSNVPKGRESGYGFDLVGKAVGEKSSYIVCEECAEERERGEGPSAFHCCPCDTVVVGLRTKAGPISCPSASRRGPSDQVTAWSLTELGLISCRSPGKFNPSPSAAMKFGWTPWDWSSLCVHARLGMPNCRCSNIRRNGVMIIKKPYFLDDVAVFCSSEDQ